MYQLLTSLRNFGNSSTNAYNILRGRLLRIVLICILASFASIGISAISYHCSWNVGWINACVACILSIAILYFTTNHKVIIGFLGLSETLEFPKPIAGIKNTDDLIKETISALLLNMCVFFAFTSFIPFGRNYGAVFTIYLAIWLAFLMDINWSMKMFVTKKFIYVFVIILFVTSFCSMLPAPLYEKAIGFDPYTWSRISKTDKMLDKIKQNQLAKDQDARESKLKTINNKIENGQTLTPGEKNYLQHEMNQAKNSFWLGMLFSEGKGETKKQKTTYRQIKFRTMDIGQHHFDLNGGETTPWLFIPNNRFYDWYCKGKADFTIYYEDGTVIEVKDDSRIKMPEKTNTKFKIASDVNPDEAQQFTFNVFKRRGA